MKPKNPKVLILTGPGGSGKTTIANLLVERCNFALLDGDNVDTEFFPKGEQWLPENSKKLREAHNKILKQTKDMFDNGKSVVVDYIIFSHYLDFFQQFGKEFGNNLDIKILFPSQEELVTRDKERNCWTTGVERINSVRKEFNNLRNKVGNEKFIDTSGQTAEETFKKYFKC
ncbi:AAA family ATPase [Patescibacteria group bacterium]|nr:AAA family ATPase [Patescibacteria group bacterium]